MKSLKNNVKYDVIKDAGFTSNNEIPYSVIANTFEKLDSTTKRLEKIEILTNILMSVIKLRPNDLLYVVYLFSNEIAAPYMNIELGIGDSLILKALCESTGRKLSEIKKDLQREGDLGLIASKSRSKQNTLFKPKPLNVKIVYNTLRKIAELSGNKSQNEKVNNIQKLFVACTDVESKYIVRHLQGKLRIGVNEQTVLSAVGRAYSFIKYFDDDNNSRKMSKKDWDKLNILEEEYIEIIKQVISEVPNYDIVIPKLIKYGILKLHDYCHLTAGIPIKAMLAKPTKGIQDILKKFDGMLFTLEYKYDGERAQIHLLSNGEIKIFSRNAEDNTTKYPDLVNNVKKYINSNSNIKSFIIDSEVVAFDRISNKILPFQTLTTRKRKDVNESDIKVNICIYCFDILLLNDEPLIELPFNDRRNIMYKTFNEYNGEFKFADHKDTNNAESIQEYLDESINIGCCEGLMVKTLFHDATYEPSKRSHNWLKCKKDYLDGVGDTLDLVVMGAYHGTGKRVGNYGCYLVGCYDIETDTFQSCCKLGTGFTDNNLKELTNIMNKYKIESNKKPYQYCTNMDDCDIWFNPEIVWEIKCADLSLSPVHYAGIGIINPDKGIGLRFPRFIRTRDDKKPNNATTSQQIVEMYQNQHIFQS